MLHEVIKLAKDKHMPYKTVKFKKYKHKKSTWITLAILKSIRYRDKLRNKLKAKMYAISSETHQLQFLKLHHFKLERV